MTRDEINKQSLAVVTSLTGLNRVDSIKILSSAIQIIAEANAPADILDTPGIAFNKNLVRKHTSFFDRHPELMIFISNLDRYYTAGEMLELIEKNFGKALVPSKSSLGRYLQRITRGVR